MGHLNNQPVTNFSFCTLRHPLHATWQRWVGVRKNWLGKWVKDGDGFGGRATCLTLPSRKLVASQMDKGMGGLVASWRFWCAAPRIPIRDLGNVLYALLIGVSIFFCEPELVCMLT